jgi:hypothetical protein
VRRCDSRIRRQQPHRDLTAPHLQGEQDAGEAVLDRRRAEHVEPDRALAGRRAPGDDDELPGVEAVGQLVELAEAGRHAVELRAATAHRLDLVERLLQDVLEPDVVLARAALGDLVDRLLRAVDDVVDVATGPGGAVTELDDARARLDQAAQDRPLPDDVGVVAGVGRRGHRRDERVQVRRAADPGERARAGELRRDRDRIGRLTPTVEVDHRVVDRLVGGPVEVARPQDLDDVGDRVLAEEHAAEDALLRHEVLRRRPVGVDPAALATRHRHDVRDAHPDLPPVRHHPPEEF